ncbi:MAG: hypothetical protein K1X78_20525 [Verrucomicrobiaceae bacterium]|nr:hypothetical protein [Verrucomicrobiaceae bacterium]
MNNASIKFFSVSLSRIAQVVRYRDEIGDLEFVFDGSDREPKPGWEIDTSPFRSCRDNPNQDVCDPQRIAFALVKVREFLDSPDARAFLGVKSHHPIDIGWRPAREKRKVPVMGALD